MLITEREDFKPLLGMDWIREINWIIRYFDQKTTLTDQSETEGKITQFEKLFKTNPTIKDIENKLQLKLGHLPIKQKDRPIPYHLQNYVKKEINDLLKFGHLEKV